MSPIERDKLTRVLAAAGTGEVRFDLHDRMLYSTDASLYQVEPVGVVIPSCVDDGARAAEICAQHESPILPRGGGTSLAGQCVNRAVVIDFSANCRSVGVVDDANRCVHVEPGVTLDELNEEIARRGHGLFFAPDVATSRHANLAGMIGNNSAGAHSILYGRTVEHVLGIDALVLGRDGKAQRVTLEQGAALRDERVRELTQGVIDVVSTNARAIRERFPKTIRRSTGYNLDLILDQLELPGDALANVNLAKLMCGSEGTLALTLGAELNLEPIPVAKGLVVVTFDSLQQAIEAVNPILETHPSAVELLDDFVLSLARKNTQHRTAVDLLGASGAGDPAAVLYVEYFAHESPDELRDRFDALGALLGGRPIRTLLDPEDMVRAWSLRKAAEPLLHGVPGMRKPVTFVEDTAVDPAKLPEFVERFRQVVEQHGTKAAYFAHASVGCLHIRPMLDLHSSTDRDSLRAIAVEVADLVREFDGALSGEHGDGRVRGPLLERMFGGELMNAFRQIKTIFDPNDLLNPGNIAEPGPVESITTKLRVLPEKEPIAIGEVETYFDYSDHGGFGSAVEMCNGAGICRKKQGGTMCPSYMATLDERHSTRGRGNALRLAISGQFGKTSSSSPLWNDTETKRTLDLCLSCKACKAECPSNVDIAKLKAEYTAQGYRAGANPPIADRLLTHLRGLNEFAARAPGLANTLSRSGMIRFVINRMMSLAPERSLPPMGRALTALVKKRPTKKASRGVVALYVDCFTGFGESHIGVAALDALETLGYEVRLLDAGCCQRPAISMGRLDRAVSKGEQLASKLKAVSNDDSVEAILFLEPSCRSAIADDLPALKMNTPREVWRHITARSMFVEEFIAKVLVDREQPVEPVGAPVIFHAHCHQKALWSDESSGKMLRLLIGDRLTTLDSGCCGMAGAFGMTRDHYDLSMKIGELSLLPSVRSAGDDAIIVAPGASCRHQIRDGASRVAIHPVQLAADILHRRLTKENR